MLKLRTQCEPTSIFHDKDGLSHSVCTFNNKRLNIYELDYKHTHFVARPVRFQGEPAHTLFWLAVIFDWFCRVACSVDVDSQNCVVRTRCKNTFFILNSNVSLVHSPGLSCIEFNSNNCIYKCLISLIKMVIIVLDWIFNSLYTKCNIKCHLNSRAQKQADERQNWICYHRNWLLRSSSWRPISWKSTAVPWGKCECLMPSNPLRGSCRELMLLLLVAVWTGGVLTWKTNEEIQRNQWQ